MKTDRFTFIAFQRQHPNNKEIHKYYLFCLFMKYKSEELNKNRSTENGPP